MGVMKMTPSQCRGARGLLDWSQTDLARAASVGLSTVYDFEKGRRAVSRGKGQAIRIALEIVGVRCVALDMDPKNARRKLRLIKKVFDALPKKNINQSWKFKDARLPTVEKLLALSMVIGLALAPT